jgi:hypothetical protein
MQTFLGFIISLITNSSKFIYSILSIKINKSEIKKYILNKINYKNYAYIKKYMFDELEHDDTVNYIIS